MSKTIIHIHIGSLIERLEVTIPPFDEKTDSDLSHPHSKLSLSQHQECLTQRVLDAVKNALKTVDKDLSLDNDQ